jgi:replicative DNA helicase
MQLKSKLQDLLPEIKRLPAEWALCACNGNKQPLGDNWQNLPLSLKDFEDDKPIFSKLTIQPKSGTRPAFNVPVEWCRSVGVLCGEPSGGMLFFDHDGRSCDQWIEETSGLPIKEALPKSALVTSGRPGRYQVIYRIPKNVWSELSTTKKRTGTVGEDGKPEQVEFRWTGTQSVALGEHPETGAYKWIYHPSDVGIADAPDWMIEQMMDKPLPQTPVHLDQSCIVKLTKCCAPVTRNALEGQYDSGRNDAGIMIARDLIGTSSYLDQIGQPYDGNPELIFNDWCRMVGLDQDNPKGQPEAIWRSANRQTPKPSLTPEMIEGCIRAQERREKQFKETYTKKPNAPSGGTELPQNEREVSDYDRLKLELQVYSQEQDPFQRHLLENQLATGFRASGSKLSSLVDALNPAPVSEFQTLAELSAEVFAQVQERAESGAVPGFLSGYTSLDEITCGFQAGDLIILAARPSIGKTALCTCMARNIAEIHDACIAFFSLEMSKHQLQYRLLSGETQIPTQRLRKGKVSDSEWPKVSSALGVLSSLNISIDDTPGLCLHDISNKLNGLADKNQSADVVIVDYLQLMEGRGSENRNLEIAKITRGLKRIARDLSVPIIVLSQLSRAVESRSDKRPIMSDLRDSGGIEQDADLIMMLYRDEYYNPNTTDKGVAELNVAKNRNGPVGMIKLNFEPNSVRFTNYKGLSYA